MKRLFLNLDQQLQSNDQEDPTIKEANDKILSVILIHFSFDPDQYPILIGLDRKSKEYLQVHYCLGSYEIYESDLILKSNPLK